MRAKSTNEENVKSVISSQNRIFSEELKRRIIQDLDTKVITISQIVAQYEVSRASVYKWRYLYSKQFQKQTKMVVQMESEATKTLKLNQRVAELERVIGQKQLEIDYLNKLIELAGKDFGVDLKKNLEPKP
ncbi:MAG TPA: transposase [Chitinophagales bacterium]|nr:transposase [Chitinophagales bacterium]HRK28212.1 transposase [Chitinophagales bacterium]